METIDYLLGVSVSLPLLVVKQYECLLDDSISIRLTDLLLNLTLKPDFKNKFNYIKTHMDVRPDTKLIQII